MQALLFQSTGLKLIPVRVMNDKLWRDGVRYLRSQPVLATLQSQRDLLDIVRGDPHAFCLGDLTPGHAIHATLPRDAQRQAAQRFVIVRAWTPAFPSRAKLRGSRLHRFADGGKLVFAREGNEVKYLLEKNRAVKIAVDRAQVAEMPVLVVLVCAERARAG